MQILICSNFVFFFTFLVKSNSWQSRGNAFHEYYALLKYILTYKLWETLEQIIMKLTATCINQILCVVVEWCLELIMQLWYVADSLLARSEVMSHLVPFLFLHLSLNQSCFAIPYSFELQDALKLELKKQFTLPRTYKKAALQCLELWF